MTDSRPWWLWPNVLALDAPAVAVTWQVFLAWGAGVAVPLAASAVLALVVWTVYLVDRGLDARRGARESDRHRVAGQYPLAWMLTASAATVVAIALTLTALPRSYLVVGSVVAAATGVYFAVVHLIRARNILDRGVKEVSVGVVFAAGVAIPLGAEVEAYTTWLPGVVAFAGLCWLNCALISMWEDGPENQTPMWAAVAAAGIALAAALRAPPLIASAVLVSTVALAVMHLARARVSVRARRVMADVVLLSPLLVPVWS